MWLGVITDERLVPDPEAIIAGFHDEFDALLTEVQEEEEAPSLEEIATRLDNVLATLDTLLAAEEAEVAPPDAPERCQALTKAGQPCKNRSLTGSPYCRVHQK